MDVMGTGFNAVIACFVIANLAIVLDLQKTVKKLEKQIQTQEQKKGEK